jgi:hypothetical protein
VRRADLREQFREIAPRELPIERPASGFPVVLKIEDALGEGVEIGEIVGR